MLLLLTRANEVDESALICAAEMALMAVELNPLIRVVESVLNAVVLIVAIWLEPKALNPAVPKLSRLEFTVPI